MSLIFCIDTRVRFADKLNDATRKIRHKSSRWYIWTRHRENCQTLAKFKWLSSRWYCWSKALGKVVRVKSRGILSGFKLLLVVGLLAGVGGGFFYVKQLQSNLEIMRLNNAKLETAVETSEKSIELLKEDNIRLNNLSDQLTKDLQKAEQYGDNLRNRLRELDLVQDAIRDSKDLEGRMNGATAKLWRELEAATGGDGNTPLPNWLLVVPRTGSESSNTDREDNSTNGSSTKTN